jgi:hypothetical protein
VFPFFSLPFFHQFCEVWWIGDHPQEDLAKFSKVIKNCQGKNQKKTETKFSVGTSFSPF